MAHRVIIRPRAYYDSVRLMRISQALRAEPGVTEAMAMMATPNNKKILATSGLLTAEAEAARPDDLVLALAATDDAAAEAAVAVAFAALDERAGGDTGGAPLPRTLDAAMAVRPDAGLVVISVPGANAPREARRALDLGLNVLLFSDNVPVADELALKQHAAEVGRLVMGPDCGTAIIGGAALGFANVVRRGPVGVVGASGTGTQEITSLLDWLGTGVSHAIGTGGRDLSAEVGGRTALAALDLLAADPGTEVIVLTSKPPAAEVAARVLEHCAGLGKPVVVNFVGSDRSGSDGRITFAPTLAGAAEAAARLAGGTAPLPALDAAARDAFLAAARDGRAPGQRYLRGLYAGGTLAYEALTLLGDRLGPVHSNLAKGALALTDPFRSTGHTVIDLGEDAYTEGRAHPMIDPYVRNQRILAEAADPETALLLLDVVIGYGAHDDPARDLAQTLAAAQATARDGGRNLPVIVTLCGTTRDPQGHAAQAAQLETAGAIVARSNAEAVALAAAVMETPAHAA
ncbi:acyl-CoA synthetase FdrA [Mesobacterium pallidum]|uniref:acyl-CoA synthetase FdrA n=1 Tax=Mesobacterium pallidum TaxID=2872037 RepID=UPI001EE1E321|nr:acyl-CoA synthetase FdrA [Mesobacterium pallidum]